MHLVIISGTLGVGKTSVIIDLIKRLSAMGRKLAVVENDFGAKGIDGDILRKNGIEVQELDGGCVCCTMKTGMIETLKFLQSNYDPETVLVEPTGIADPSYILNTVDGISGLTVTRKTTIVVTDAERFMKIRKFLERPLRNQLNVADLVLINKIDTQPDDVVDGIEEEIRTLSYDGPILRVNAESGTNMERIPEEADL